MRVMCEGEYVHIVDSVVTIVTPLTMTSIARLVERMRSSPTNFSYSDLHRVCIHFFGIPRQNGTSHAVFKTPWPGDPRVNIQNHHEKAKAYQVRQALIAIDKLEGERQ